VLNGEKNKYNTAQRLYREKQYCTEALQRKTILHRGFTESIKRKHTEDNKAHRKHRHSEGDGYSLKRGK